MLHHFKQAQNLITAEEGATVVEYGVVVALVIAACITIILFLGGRIQGGFENFSQSLEDVGINAPPPNP